MNYHGFNYVHSTVKKTTNFFETRADNLQPEEDKKSSSSYSNKMNKEKKSKKMKRDVSDSSIVELIVMLMLKLIQRNDKHEDHKIIKQEKNALSTTTGIFNPTSTME